MDESKEVVVTGIGSVTPYGFGTDVFLKSMKPKWNGYKKYYYFRWIYVAIYNTDYD